MVSETTPVAGAAHAAAPWRRPRFWVWRGVVLLLIAGLLQAASPTVLGTPGVRIYVRWTSTVDDAARVRLERELGLDEARPHEGRTWTYRITDASTEHIRAIVTHPSVEDTHKVDRTTFQPSPDADRTPLQGGLIADGERLARVPAVAGAAFALLACGLFLLAGATVWRRPEALAARLDPLGTIASHPAHASIAAARAAVNVVQRGIPAIDARTAGIFRVIFGALLLTFLAMNAVDASWLPQAPAEATGALHGFILETLAGYPGFIDRIWIIALVLGAAFTVGVLTRWTFAAFVAMFLLWVSVYVAHRGSHTSTAIALALVALLPSRWGDGFSVDARMRRDDRSAALRGARYGYSPWVLVLVLGLCFAAAAWSKVKDGVSWIANGTVAFHFISDSPQALVPWGLWVARSHALSVTFSLIAVATEALIIAAAFTRDWRYRAAAGIGATFLLAGFVLFQGVVWPLWWILLLGFVPWERFSDRDHHAGDAAVLALSRSQLWLVGFLVIQQIVISAARSEMAPLFSPYDMYSATYASREAFDATRPTTYRLLDVSTGTERELPCRIDEALAVAFEQLAAGKPVEEAAVADRLRPCVPGSTERVMLVGDRLKFDWDRGELQTERGTAVIGPISLARVYSK